MKVIVVDDDAIVAASMKTILTSSPDVEVPEIGYDGMEAVALYEKYQPDILLTDIQMKRMSGLEAAAKILAKDKAAKIIFLTTFADDEYIKEALKVGAKGYILKQDFEGVLPAIKAVFSGQSVFGDRIVHKIPQALENKDYSPYHSCGITDKEFEIIELVAQGYSNKEIADKLFLSEGTVRNYLSTILEKLDLRDRTQLAIFYYKH